MSVTLEPCEGSAFVARSGPEHHQHGDPYDMACTVDVHGDLAIVKGLATDKQLTRDVVRDLGRLLKEQGIKTMRIERMRDGQLVEQNWDIS